MRPSRQAESLPTQGRTVMNSHAFAGWRIETDGISLLGAEFAAANLKFEESVNSGFVPCPSTCFSFSVRSHRREWI